MKKISLFVVTAAAVALVLSGCSRGPGTDDMEMMPSLDGTWVFDGFQAIIDGTAVEVTVGNGVDPLPTANPAYAVVTQIVAKGNLAPEGTAYKLTLSEEADAITVTPAAAGATVVPVLKGLIMTAESEDVMITVDEDVDPNTITVMGSFLDTLWELLELGVPEAGLTGCKGAPCMMAP
jgi:hypothetical protein